MGVLSPVRLKPAECVAHEGPASARGARGATAGAPGSEPREWVHGGGVLFFTADDGATGRELRALPFRPGGECPLR